MGLSFSLLVSSVLQLFRGCSSGISNCLGPGFVGVKDPDPFCVESGLDERAGLGARIMGTELGRTLSDREPRCVGELFLLDSDGNGGCNTTQTCCPPVGGEVMLLPTFGDEGRSVSGITVFSDLSPKK